jgi:hypothetical protein
MTPRHIFVAFVVAVAIGGSLAGAARARQTTPPDGHVAWVADALRRMQTIKPGMTRKELLLVFTKEGGLSTRLHRTFVSRDCPYSRRTSTLKPLVPQRATRTVA